MMHGRVIFWQAAPAAALIRFATCLLQSLMDITMIIVMCLTDHGMMLPSPQSLAVLIKDSCRCYLK